MGNGTSSHVKSIKIKQKHRATRKLDQVDADLHDDDVPVRERRSNSDGCIVENLNSSKSKVDMLQMQLKESQDRAEQAEERAHTVEQQMSEVEGVNFELLDKVISLEEEIEVLRRDANQDDFTGTVMAQDQSIEKLEKENKVLQDDLKKLRLKAKKRIKSVQTELAESKQESALKIYALKQEISKLEEESSKLTQHLDRVSSVSKSKQVSTAQNAEDIKPEWEDSRTKLILELSSQVSILDEKINELEEELRVKDNIIQELQQLQQLPPSGTRRGSASRTLKQRPGSGDSDAPKPPRISSGGSSRYSSGSREDVRVGPELDSGISLEDTSGRLSSAPPRMTAESAETPSGSSANDVSRRRRRVLKHSSMDDKHMDKGINSRSLDSSQTELDSENRPGRGETRKKPREAFTSEQPRTKRYTDRPVPKLAANFADELIDDIDIIDRANDNLKKRKKKQKPRISSSTDKVCLDAALGSESSLQEVHVP